MANQLLSSNSYVVKGGQVVIDYGSVTSIYDVNAQKCPCIVHCLLVCNKHETPVAISSQARMTKKY